MLKKYIKASEGCLLSPFENEISSTLYNQLINLGWKDGVQISKIINLNNMEKGEIIKIEKINLPNQGITYMSLIVPTEPAQAVLFIPSKVKTTLEAPLYRTKPNYIKLAEREAIEFFYSEANEIRQEYVNMCVDKEPAQAHPHMQ